uniref:GP96 n=1 Tax=Caviid herpesvirus 2 str. CIDMTR TaxID=1415526 RepID=U6H8G6_9BETA|nr:GP96 [Caviid herpesvirus 2 str. CIDMTR]
MTSKKELLKETMRHRLEQKHCKFLSDALGETHPSVEQQRIRAACVAFDLERLATLSTARALLDVSARRASDAQKRTALTKGLLDGDTFYESNDVLIEINDRVAELKDNVLDAARSVSEDP